MTQTLNTQLIQFSVTDAAIAEMAQNYLAIVVSGHDDKDNAALARAARLEVKDKRIAVEKRRKELKADALAYGKEVDAQAKLIFDALEPIEAHLQAQEDIVKLHEQRLEQEAAAERQRQIDAEIKLMEEEKAQMEAERQAMAAERQRLADERAKIELEKQLREEAEAKRIADDLRNAQAIVKMAEEAEAEKKRLEAQAEAAKLKAEQDAIEAAKRAEQEKARAVEQARLEAEQKAAEREEQIRIAEEARLKQAEQLRIAEEARLKQIEDDRIEAERQAALAPDKDKLAKLVEQIKAITIPEVGEDAKKITDEVIILLGKVSTFIEARASKL